MKRFILDVLRKFAVSLASMFLLGFFLLVLFSWVFSSLLQPPQTVIHKSSFLVLDLTMNLTERPGGQTFEDLAEEALTGERKPTQAHLLEILDAFRRAKDDNRIIGILVTGGFQPKDYGCGYSTVLEMIDGLDDFKESGKPVIGFCHSPTQLDYLVYAACDELIMDPAGTLLLNGLAAQDLFLGETFAEYGVGMQVVRTGRFKGAVEPLTSTGYSPENREQIERLLGLRWNNYLEFVAGRRNLVAKELNASLADRYLFEAADALAAGLVDQVLAHDQFVDLIIEKGALNEDGDWFEEVALIDYLDRPQPGDSLGRRDNPFRKPEVAVIYVEGVIMDGGGDDGSTVGGAEIVSRIRSSWSDEKCKAIVLRVNSPGGSVSGSDAILREISRARAEDVPVVVSMGAVAASGGYWIASDCDLLLAHEQTITGSIGVFGLLPNLKELGKRFGAYFDSIKTHPSADLLGVSRPKDDREMTVLQKHVESLYEKFLILVANGRNLDLEAVRQCAEGRVWMGKDAHGLGLVQELGGLYDAIDRAAGLADLNDYEVVEMPEVSNPMDDFAQMLDSDSKSRAGSQFSGISKLAQMSGWEELHERLGALNDPRCSYSWLSWYRGSFGFRP